MGDGIYDLERTSKRTKKGETVLSYPHVGVRPPHA